VELAVLLPFLLYLCVIAVDWARLMYFTITINDCARSGAIWASDAELRMKSRYTTVRDAALAEAPELDPTATVASVPTTYEGNAGVAVTVTMPFRTITNFPGVPANETLIRTVKMRLSPMASR
jgi:Flp pilus assembly protein TadG